MHKRDEAFFVGRVVLVSLQTSFHPFREILKKFETKLSIPETNFSCNQKMLTRHNKFNFKVAHMDKMIPTNELQGKWQFQSCCFSNRRLSVRNE